MAISEKFLETLIGHCEQTARNQAELQFRAYLDVTPRCYGETVSSVCVFRAESMLELRKQIRDRRWRKNGDNPGQRFAQSCELLKVIRGDSGFNAVAIVSNHFDV